MMLSARSPRTGEEQICYISLNNMKHSILWFLVLHLAFNNRMFTLQQNNAFSIEKCFVHHMTCRPFLFSFFRTQSSSNRVYYQITPKFLRCGHNVIVKFDSRIFRYFCTSASSRTPHWNMAAAVTGWTMSSLELGYTSTDIGPPSKFWFTIKGLLVRYKNSWFHSGDLEASLQLYNLLFQHLKLPKASVLFRRR